MTEASGRHWQHFEHGADIGVEGRGTTLAEAFAQAAVALTAVICDPLQVKADEPVDIRCEEPDPELLLADWLNALVYEMAARRMIFSRFEVEIDGGTLQARAWGERLDRARHQPSVEVKGATYTELKVGRSAEGEWFARCVVDV
jgi:tRNA nucleotidyltransferase (CCA-adding enzyme)